MLVVDCALVVGDVVKILVARGVVHLVLALDAQSFSLSGQFFILDILLFAGFDCIGEVT